MMKSLMSGAALAGLLAMSSSAFGAELRFMCYEDGVECQTWQTQLEKFQEENPDITVNVDVVPYKTILESLPLQLESGEGPDMARVTDLGGLAQYMLDIRPLVEDADYWDESFGPTLAWTRVNGEGDNGIYNLMDQLTVTGAFVNKTLFEQAGIDMPVEGATFDEWAEAARKVAEATQTPYAMAMDRSGHRFAGPAISYGAKFFDEEGNPITVDDGFRDFSAKFVEWHNDGTMAKEVWAGSGGSSYKDAAAEFINGSLVYYISGSWQVGRMGRDIGDAFDWVVVPPACGEGGCTGVPGGAAVVGFKSAEHPEEVAKVLDFMAREDVQSAYMAATKNIPAHRKLQEAGIAYENATDAEKAALTAFSKALPEFSPVAFQFQGYKHNRAIMNAIVERLTQAIVGESSLDEALARIDVDVKEAVASAQ